MHATPEPAITVAVISWNTRDLLGACLRSLQADADAGRAAVWVVDNGSGDGSPQLVRDEFPWVTLVEPDANLGFGPAINLVAERTTSPWLVGANADVAVQPGALERLLRTASARPRVGMVGPRLLLLDGSTQPSVQPFPGPDTSALLALHAGGFSDRAARRLCLPGAWDPDRAAAVPWVTGALMLMAREAFEQAGGFDASQWLYAEDIDLCWRMREHGWEIWYEPEAHVNHAHSAASTSQFGAAGLSTHMTAATYLWMVRRRGAVPARTAAAIDVAAAAARTAVLAPLAARDPERFAQRRALARAQLDSHLLGLRSRRWLERTVRPPAPKAAV